MKTIVWVLAALVIVVVAIFIYALARSKVDPVVWTPAAFRSACESMATRI